MGENNRGLKLENTIPALAENHESQAERRASAEGVAKAKKERFVSNDEIENEVAGTLEATKMRDGTSELIVITKMKKLASYIITVTEKSPKKFRGVFVNRLQNYCLDTLEHLIEANSLRKDSLKNKEKRKECQHKAFVKMKLIGYISFLALESGCIIKKQYQQIALQNADCINLLVAWRKSDSKI